MTLELFQRRVRLIAIWSWGLMAFCLPFSTALTLIFSTFGVLFGLLGFDWLAFKTVMRGPIAILCVALFAWLALSMLWSIAPRDELIEGISKYRKLLYVPLVAMLLVSTRAKPWFLINFFVAGCLVVCIGSLSSSSGLLEYLIGPQLPGGGWGLGGGRNHYWLFVGPPAQPTFGRSYIAQGAFLVVSVAYLIGIWASSKLIPASAQVPLRIGPWTVICLVSVLLFTVVMLNGRTGIFLCFILFLFWTLKLSRIGRGALALKLVIVGLITLVASSFLNPQIYSRISTAVKDVKVYQTSDQLTSQGERLRFWQVGVTAGLDRPFQGWGVGSYAQVFAEDASQPSELRSTRPHPHSELVLQFVQGGGGAFFLWLAIVWNVAIRIPMKCKSTSHRNGILGDALAIATCTLLVSGIFNSIVWDLAEGHALSFLLASVLVAVLADE